MADSNHDGQHREPPKCPKCGRPLAFTGASCIYCTRSTKSLRRILRLLVPHRGKIAAITVLNLVAVVIGLIPPYLSKPFFDKVIAVEDGSASLELRLHRLIAIVAILAVAAFIKWVVTYAGGRFSAQIGAGIVQNLRSRLHGTITRLELRFFGTKNSGEYTGRIMHDTEDIQRFLVDGSSEVFVQLLTMLGIGAVLFSMDWILALIVFIPAPLFIFLSRSFQKRVHDLFRRQSEAVAKLNTHISETINGLRTIKAFALEKRRSKIFDATNDEAASVRVGIETKFLMFGGGLNTLIAVTTALVWLVAGWRILRYDSLTLGDVMAFTSYIAAFYGPIRWMSYVVNEMINALVSAERVFYILDAPYENQGTEHGLSLPSVKGAIEIKNLHFSYDPGKEVLKGLDLSIRPGEMIGLVGRSGVGKSTLINLVCRFYNPDSGEILIDGHPLADLNLETYRKQIGIVLQEPFLFNSSIYDNIACSRPGATKEEVVAAAKAAYAHDFIMEREEGYQTLAGEGGALLSGGEKQRIAIARAILHNPPILILDEATSAVDTETEYLIRNALAALCKGRTVIAIAHRLSTLRHADRLAVLDDGRVAELGTHDELIARNGIYTRLVNAQTKMNEIKSNTWNP